MNDADPKRRRPRWWEPSTHATVGIPISLLLLVGIAALVAAFEPTLARQEDVFKRLVVGQPLLLVLGVVLFTCFERFVPRHRQPILRAEVRTDIAHVLLSPVMVAALSVVLFLGTNRALAASFGSTSIAATARFLAEIPAWAVLLLAVVLDDFLKFSQHLLAHRIPLLWRFHSVHHSSTKLDWLAGERFHPIDGLWGIAVRTLPFTVLGLTVYEFGAVRLLVGLFDLFNHANVRWRWRWLGPIIVTPEYHHWHHVDRPEAYNTNFASLLPIWDIVFGTFRLPKDERPERYGIPAEMPPSYLGQMVQPFLRSWSPGGSAEPRRDAPGRQRSSLTRRSTPPSMS